MLGRKSRPPMIGLLTGSFISGNRSGVVEVAASSPRSPKNFDCGGVGLGIVAALEKSSDAPAVFSRNLSRSSPIPVNSPRRGKPCLEEMESAESWEEEEYTIVTYHEPNRSYTKVYGGRGGGDRSPFRIQNSQKSSVFHIAPARVGEAAGAPASDFLSSCHLCQKKLHGEDIYMYRGEKAFCSSECRYRQMVMDERTENCSSEASRAVDVSSSPYANGQIFTAGILAI